MAKKKIIIIAIVVLILILVLLVIFNIFSKKENGATSEFVSSLRSPEEFLADAVGSQKDEKFIRLTQGPISGYRLTDAGILVSGVDGSVSEIDNEGTILREIINLSLDNVLTSKISTSGNVVFLTIAGADQQERWVLFSEDDGKLKALSQDTSQVSFSPQGKMLSVLEDGDVSSVVVDKQTIFTTKIPDLTASWQNEEVILLTTRPSGLAPGIAYSLDVKRGRAERLLGSQHGLTALGSHDEERLVFSETNKDGKHISMRLLASGIKSNLDINTLPEKCTFSQDSRFLFCSLFAIDVSFQLMPDDYYKDVFTNDSTDIIKINLTNGETEILAKNLLVDGIGLQLSRDEQWLFFINKKDGGLFRLKLE